MRDREREREHNLGGKISATAVVAAAADVVCAAVCVTIAVCEAMKEGDCRTPYQQVGMSMVSSRAQM